MPAPPSQNGRHPGRWADAPCPACGAAGGCRVAADAVACRTRGGPLAEPRVAAKAGVSYFVHPRDPATGAVYDPDPA